MGTTIGIQTTTGIQKTAGIQTTTDTFTTTKRRYGDNSRMLKDHENHKAITQLLSPNKPASHKPSITDDL